MWPRFSAAAGDPHKRRRQDERGKGAHHLHRGPLDLAHGPVGGFQLGLQTRDEGFDGIGDDVVKLVLLLIEGHLLLVLLVNVLLDERLKLWDGLRAVLSRVEDIANLLLAPLGQGRRERGLHLLAQDVDVVVHAALRHPAAGHHGGRRHRNSRHARVKSTRTLNSRWRSKKVCPLARAVQRFTEFFM